MRVIIAGAGVGGLSLALMLQRRGIDARHLRTGIRSQGTRRRHQHASRVAIRELSEIGLLPALDLAGIRTRELIYLNRQGQEVWRELRGIDGGHPLPQFSIHRGRLQKVLYDAVIERLGAEAVQTGQRLSGFPAGRRRRHRPSHQRLGRPFQPHRARRRPGRRRRHPLGRAKTVLSEGGRPLLERRDDVAGCHRRFEKFLDGRTMFIGGGMGAKFVLYPIAEGADGKMLTNWVVNVRVADGGDAAAAEGQLVQTRAARRRPSLRQALRRAGRRHRGPGARHGRLLRISHVRPRSASSMDLRPRHPARRRRPSHVPGRLQWCQPGDSSTPAVSPTPCRRAELPTEALYRYEKERLAKTAAIVKANRKGGPERV